MKTQLIYKLDDVDAEEGIDIFEIAPVLMEFGQLVRSANTVLDLGLEIDVRVRPFREGSWITEFVFHSGPVKDVFNFLNTREGFDLTQLLALLGIGVKDGVVGLAHIIRFTHGWVSNFHSNKDNTVTYRSPDGAEITVSMPEHRLAQSPIIQNNYYKSVIVPLDKFPKATAVTVSVGSEEHVAQRFTVADKPAFEKYVTVELAEGRENVTSTMSGVFVKPKRGPYSGDEQNYSFMMGDTTLYPVTIEDEAFLGQLKTGDVRPFSEDVLKVDVAVTQTRDRRNRITTRYVITKVIEYLRFEQPQQLGFGDTRPK